MAMIEITEATLQELFNLVRGVDSKLNVIVAQVAEKEKRCVDHVKQTDDHEKRLRDIEIWRAAQTGTTGFIWKIVPMIFGAGSLIIAVVALTRK